MRYTFEEFDQLLKIMEEEEHQTGKSKGIEYGLTDRTGNFHRLGEEIKVTCPHCHNQFQVGPMVVLWIFLKKHLDAILSYVNGRREDLSESINDRIKDARVYLSLFRALVEEEKNEMGGCSLKLRGGGGGSCDGPGGGSGDIGENGAYSYESSEQRV